MTDTLPEAIASLIRNAASLPPGVHRFAGVQVRIGSQAALTEEVQQLTKVKDLALICAPEVVELIETGPGSAALITRWLSCATGELLPAKSASTPAKIGFAQDMKTLTRAGFLHAFAGNGLGSYLIASDTGAILLDDWGSALRQASAGERNDNLSDIDAQLAKLR